MAKKYVEKRIVLLRLCEINKLFFIAKIRKGGGENSPAAFRLLLID